LCHIPFYNFRLFSPHVKQVVEIDLLLEHLGAVVRVVVPSLHQDAAALLILLLVADGHELVAKDCDKLNDDAVGPAKTSLNVELPTATGRTGLRPVILDVKKTSPTAPKSENNNPATSSSGWRCHRRTAGGDRVSATSPFSALGSSKRCDLWALPMSLLYVFDVQ
jgi:hypothetical protein